MMTQMKEGDRQIGGFVELGREIWVQYPDDEKPTRLIIVNRGELIDARSQAEKGVNVISSDYPFAKMLLNKPFGQEVVINFDETGPQRIKILEPEEKK